MTFYYVGPKGSNSSTGKSVSSAFRTLAYAYNKLYPGDTLYILDGKWSESWDDSTNTLPRSGSSGQPITIKGSGSNALMENDNHGVAICLINRSYINIENIEIFHYSQGIYCNDVSNINIHNCHIHYIGTSTISFKDADNCSIDHCDLSDTGWNNVQIMSTHRDTHHISIQNSKVHGCPGISNFNKYHNGIDIFNSDPNGNHQVRDMQIINNKLYDMTNYAQSIFTHGYETKHMDNFVIADNEIYDTARTIISFFRNLEFRNNNMYNNTIDGFRTLYPEKLVGPAYIHGNIVRNSNYDTRIVATGNGILFEHEDYGLLHIEGGSVVFRNPLRKSITIKDSGSGKITFQLTDGRNFTHNGKNNKTSILGGYQLIIDGETVLINISGTAPPTTTPTSTPTTTFPINFISVPPNASVDTV